MDDSLLNFVFSDNLKMVKKYILNDPTIINKRYSKYKLHILHYSVLSHSNKVLNYLLNLGISPNIITSERMTPLHMACKNGNNYAVKKLLSNNANVNKRTKKGKTPLLIAAHKGYFTIVSMLINYGAKINSKETKKNSISCRLRTPLQIASECGHTKIVKKLSKHTSKH